MHRNHESTVLQTLPRDIAIEYEYVLIDATECLVNAMGSMTKAELAREAGVARSHITQVLSGRRNLTLKTLVRLLWHCGYKLELSIKRRY